MKILSLSLVGHVGFFSKEFNDRHSRKTNNQPTSDTPAQRRRQALNLLCNKKEFF